MFYPITPCTLLAPTATRHLSNSYCVRRRRLYHTLNSDLLHRREPRLALGVVRLLARERVLAHLDVRPRRVRVAPLGEHAQEVAVRDDRDSRLRARAQPAPDPPCARGNRSVRRGVRARFGRPVGREQGEVEGGVLGVGLEGFAGLVGGEG